eukprot:PITA_26556
MLDLPLFFFVVAALHSFSAISMALVNGRPHALMFPFPAQGHIQAMMQLAKVLYARGFYITFVNTEYIQQRLLRSGSIDSVKPRPDFRFETISDGLPAEHVRTSKLPELCRSLTDNVPLYFDMLIDKIKHLQTQGVVPPLTCIVSDGLLSFPQKTARKLGIPRVAFWTHSACGFSTYFFMPLLVDNGYIPLKDEKCLTNGYKEELITCIPGMAPLRVKDLPSSLLLTENSNYYYVFEFNKIQAQATLEADLVILNTFDELDRPVVDALQKRLPPLYTIGPLLLQAESVDDRISDVSASMWTEETGCAEWLDSQEPCSVIYVCFGSVSVMSEEEVLEFAWGLEASRQPFLWAIRPDLIRGQTAALPCDFLEKVKYRSFFVRWAPQMKVLSHPSVGGFLTHSGWNSTLESICAGVPMISWPFFSEQPTNRRFVSEVWKIGMAMKEVVKREHVADTVRRLMRGEEGRRIRKRIVELRDASVRAVEKGGSSYNNMDKFVEDIRRLTCGS